MNNLMECPECGERIGRNAQFCETCMEDAKAAADERAVDEWNEDRE